MLKDLMKSFRKGNRLDFWLTKKVEKVASKSTDLSLDTSTPWVIGNWQQQYGSTADNADAYRYWYNNSNGTINLGNAVHFDTYNSV